MDLVDFIQDRVFEEINSSATLSWIHSDIKTNPLDVTPKAPLATLGAYSRRKLSESEKEGRVREQNCVFFF